jgi:hypothetical protein
MVMPETHKLRRQGRLGQHLGDLLDAPNFMVRVRVLLPNVKYEDNGRNLLPALPEGDADPRSPEGCARQ